MVHKNKTVVSYYNLKSYGWFQSETPITMIATKGRYDHESLLRPRIIVMTMTHRYISEKQNAIQICLWFWERERLVW